ncbi:carboxypeptidase-like regulatory domain-containing protein [Niastella populi]|nr:carboxypeptidase-like regulatory domain-containing protein [Niastella populi]
MTPKEKGRFCGSCRKTVVDFTAMSDKEMLDTITKAAGQPLCGRFANDQLHRKIEPAINKRRFSVPYIWNVLLAGMLFFESCDDSTTGEVERVEIVEDNEVLGKIAVDDSVTCHQPPLEINGKVYNLNTGLPVAGAQVRLLGSTREAAVTDSMGKFSLGNDTGKAVILEVTAQNFFTNTVQLNNYADWNDVEVAIKEEALMGAVLVQLDTTSKGKEKCKKEK